MRRGYPYLAGRNRGLPVNPQVRPLSQTRRGRRPAACEELSVRCGSVKHEARELQESQRVKAESKTETKGGVPVDVHTGLEQFWCSDCLSIALFERIVDAVAGSEWACTACGAAYFDAIDLVVEPHPSGVRRTA
jgi:hypothetical protein